MRGRRASVPKCVFHRGVTSTFVVSSWILVLEILKSYCSLPKLPPAALLTPKPATGNPAADTRRITVALTTQNILETLARLTNPGPLPKNWHVCGCLDQLISFANWDSCLVKHTNSIANLRSVQLARCDVIAVNHGIATLESPVIVFMLSAATDLWPFRCPVFSHHRSF